MQEGLAGLPIGVITDIRFDQDVADSVVGKALGDINADLRRRQPTTALSAIDQLCILPQRLAYHIPGNQNLSTGELVYFR